MPTNEKEPPLWIGRVTVFDENGNIELPQEGHEDDYCKWSPLESSSFLWDHLFGGGGSGARSEFIRIKRGSEKITLCWRFEDVAALSKPAENLGYDYIFVVKIVDEVAQEKGGSFYFSYFSCTEHYPDIENKTRFESFFRKTVDFLLENANNADT